MSTHYGLQIQSPFDLAGTQPVIISVLAGQTKTISRGQARGLLAIVVQDGAELNFEEEIIEDGLYHTYIYLQGERSKATIVSKQNLKEGIADIGHHIVHEKNNTSSQIKTRAIVSNSAEIIYTSQIAINPGLRDIDGQQSARFMLEGMTSKVKTIPGLSVFTDDVNCSHSLAITPIDEKALLFLTSRGFKLDQATEMVKEIFLQ